MNIIQLALHMYSRIDPLQQSRMHASELIIFVHNDGVR
jgi:hypothetical protein